MTIDPTTLRPATRLVQGGVHRTAHGETAEALFLTSGFVYDDAEQAEATFNGTAEHYQYSRFANPTLSMFEERLCLIEGAEACRATATGMAAVNAALLSHLKAGDRVVASRALFGSCHWIVSTLLPKFGIEAVFVDGSDLAQWRDALRKPTNLVLLETPSNPMLEIVDLPAVASLAHAAGAIVVVDNVFATPLLQQPLKLGADVVVYSCTKHIDGQGRVLGGAVLADRKWVNDVLQPFIRNTGPAMSAFNAWVLLKGLETLPLRVDAGCRAAEAIAEFLAAQSGVTRVWYPTRADHPQRELAMQQMSAGGHRGDVRGRRRQSRCVSGHECVSTHCRFEQPGRFEVARYAPGDYDPYAYRRGGAGETRDHRWRDPAFGWSGRCRGHQGRSGPRTDGGAARLRRVMDHTRER
jgi:O-succinylhomoserine sulfhydrylase